MDRFFLFLVLLVCNLSMCGKVGFVSMPMLC
jgi:hypothetical protein